MSAWPSPRSWEMASQLHAIGLDVAAAVGAPTASEFNAFVGLYGRLPDIEQILAGHGDGIAFPDEPSVRYATTVGLTARAADAQAGYHALRWLACVAAGEWVQLCAADLFKLMRAKGQWRRLKQIIGQDAELRAWFAEHQRLLEEPSAGAGDIAFFR